MRARVLPGAMLLLASACSGKPYELAPVSGKITLNGKALAKAWVHFAPVAAEGALNPGPTSHGQTDEAGMYTLHVKPGTDGAVVGKHKVFISLIVGGSTDADAGNKKGVERIPARYNQATTLEFEVKADGTTEANFELTAP